MHIAILGAGSIGCFVGGAWQAAGLRVHFVGRKTIANDIAEHGLKLTDQDGWEVKLPPAIVDFAVDPSALTNADLIAVTVKSGATEEAARQILTHAKPGTTVLSLQNGISNIDTLRRVLGEDFPVVRGMVPYNVAYLGRGKFHKGVAGHLYAEDVPVMRDLSARIRTSPAGFTLSETMVEIAWGKLLINLNNAVNALSGKPLIEQLAQRDYRQVVAAAMREGLGLLHQSGISPAKVGPVPPRWLPSVIGSSDWLFNRLFLKMQKIDSHARSSMADDLAHGRKTEIDYLNGELIGLAKRLGEPAPVNRAIVELVREAEDGGRREWSAAELRRAVLG